MEGVKRTTPILCNSESKITFCCCYGKMNILLDYVCVLEYVVGLCECLCHSSYCVCCSNHLNISNIWEIVVGKTNVVHSLCSYYDRSSLPMKNAILKDLKNIGNFNACDILMQSDNEIYEPSFKIEL